ncbi:MAG: hypothetical protein AAGH57_05740 [Pseudomonadota bacterium]
MTDEPLDTVPIPPLIDVLLIKEREKMEEVGAPLTETEVLTIRDNVVCMALPRSVHVQLIQGRGYCDIDPDNVWAEWQAALAERDGSS